MTTESQIPKIVGQLVTHQAVFGDLSTQDAQWVIQKPAEAIELFIQAVQNRPNKSSLLESVSTVMISATTEKFVAKDHFIVNTSDDAPVKIAYISDSFRETFLQGDGKIEDPITEQILRCSKLLKSSVDTPIITELGEDKAEIFLREFWHLLKNQPRGGDGMLLTNGYANIFYIRNSRGVFYTVNARWFSGGWGLNVYSVEDPREWDAGGQIISRNS